MVLFSLEQLDIAAFLPATFVIDVATLVSKHYTPIIVYPRDVIGHKHVDMNSRGMVAKNQMNTR